MNKTVEFSAKNGKLHLINTEQNHLNNPTVVPFAPGQENKGVQYKIIVPLKSSDEKQGFIGALYLNKYSNEAFSEIEKFALELFAKQAALIIKNQHIIS
jgi:transcriptional regulator with GAF, ATPase, and Fis domain